MAENETKVVLVYKGRRAARKGKPLFCYGAPSRSGEPVDDMLFTSKLATGGIGDCFECTLVDDGSVRTGGEFEPKFLRTMRGSDVDGWRATDQAVMQIERLAKEAASREKAGDVGLQDAIDCIARRYVKVHGLEQKEAFIVWVIAQVRRAAKGA